MGLGVQNTNCRLRTIWTPEMDRYFIDLMLEQVDKENRKDEHLFSKRAWKHMTSMFNAKFNSKYEQDVLKNRHKMLRNLYRAIRNLLEQKGFRWDESRQMVTADNKDWDDYIQAHPDARPYRVKTIPYYIDLINLYGSKGVGREGLTSGANANLNENISETNSGRAVCTIGDYESVFPKLSHNMMELGCISRMATESLHDIMIDEDYSISMSKDMVEETCQFLSDFSSRTRTYWEPPMDRYFIYLILDQVNKGNHIDGLLRKQGWREMISLFNAKFGFNYTVDILKNRYKTLRRQHNVVQNLLDLDGFAWDDARQMVIADDHAWQSYIKTHTDARQYMTRPVPYFKDLSLIFRELNSDEKDSLSSQPNLDTLDEGTEMKFIAVNQSPAASVSSYNQSHKENGTSDLKACSNQATKRGLDAPPTPDILKKSRSENEGLVHTIREMATAVSSLADKRREDEVVPVEVVVSAIQALPDMDEELVLDACDLLEDDKKAKTFLALDVKLRKKWLMRKLRPSQSWR